MARYEHLDAIINLATIYRAQLSSRRSILRGGHLLKGLVLAVALLPLCGVAHAKGEFTLQDLAISPDGRVVAFQFSPAKGPDGLGLYEWQTGRLKRIPNPLGKRLGAPSFAYDGERLAVVSQNLTEGVVSDIAVVDLAALSVTQITHANHSGTRGKTNPVFQPGTDNILYVERGIGVFNHLKLVNIYSGTERTVLDESHGFINSIFRASFVGLEEIYFTAIAPANPRLQKEVDDLGAENTSATIAYRLNFGGEPEILSPQSEIRLRDKFYHAGLSSLSSSKDGRTTIFISKTNRESTSKFFYDVFKFDSSGSEDRLTHLNGYLTHARISYNGSIVAFFPIPTGNDVLISRSWML
jgi:Tol biopolymer transport system component